MATTLQDSLAVPQDFDEQHESAVRAEIERFRAKAAELLAGAITEDDFRAFRLRAGIYGQRQPACK